MSSMSVILLPENLRSKLGEQAAKELVDLINDTTKNTKQNISDSVTERIERRLSEVKADLIKWMFVFWIGQIAVIIGIITVMIK